MFSLRLKDKNNGTVSDETHWQLYYLDLNLRQEAASINPVHKFRVSISRVFIFSK